MPDHTAWIRAAVEDDLVPMLRLLSRADEGRDAVADEPSELQRSTWATMLATDTVTVYVADGRTELAGTATLIAAPTLGYDCRPTAFVESVLVNSAWRRRGVARAILTRLLDDAAAQGCHKIQLLAHKRHATDGAHDFYRSLGFEAEAEGFRLYLGPRG
ncbi:MAG: GNAT family N-acetyltransferase [Actinomycetota bacterium]